jgi:hypothetical protein
VFVIALTESAGPLRDSLSAPRPSSGGPNRTCKSDRVVNWVLTNVSHRSVLVVLSHSAITGHTSREI